MSQVFLLAPRECWHTKDLLGLQSYGFFSYTLVYDTPPFLTRDFFKRSFPDSFPSYEFLQRLWRIVTLPLWSLYLFLRLRFSTKIVHCHGLFSFVISIISFLPPSRIVFTPQGSDILSYLSNL